MSVEAHIQAIRTRLLADSTITSHHIIREQSTPSIGQMRARLTFTDGSWLEFSEVIRKEESGDIQTLAYSYHWMATDNQLRMRWDNARHYPNLPNFPHHLHDGDEKNVLPGEPMNLFKVLDYIADRLTQSTA